MHPALAVPNTEVPNVQFKLLISFAADVGAANKLKQIRIAGDSL